MRRLKGKFLLSFSLFFFEKKKREKESSKEKEKRKNFNNWFCELFIVRLSNKVPGSPEGNALWRGQGAAPLRGFGEASTL